jgi:hypothetical protein
MTKTQVHRRAILAGLPAAAVMAGAAPAAAPGGDSIFAALDEHRAAYDAWQAAPEDLGHEADRAAARGREQDAFFKVFGTAPVTPAGVAALLAWLAGPEHPGGCSRAASTSRTPAHQLRASCRRRQRC